MFGVGDDKARHAGPINMPEMIELNVRCGSITIEGPPPFVAVPGDLANDGSFSITGNGIVAGFRDVGVLFEGTISVDGLVGSYRMGTSGGLPTGEPIVYNVESVAVIPAEVDLAGFYQELSTSLQNGEINGPFEQLHPAVFDRYGSNTCEAYLTEVANPGVSIEFIQVLDLAPYDYPTDDLTTPVGYAYNVEIQLTVDGEPQLTTANIVVAPNGTILWFTDCGDPTC